MIFRIFVFLFIFCSCQTPDKSSKKNINSPDRPNIVIIYLDDLGYGDVGSYGSIGIETPNIDRLANGGIKFTDGYATSSTCTPSRYALLTGTYPWRNRDAKILPGTAPLIIDTSQLTIPKLLKKHNYATGIVGKWHLGLGDGNVNWNKHISPGPNELGFDYSYILAATQDRVPTVYIENGMVDGLDPNDPIEVSYQQNFEGEPTGKDHPELLTMKWHHGHNQSIVNGVPRIGYMKGGDVAKWSDIDMADHFLTKAQNFVKEHKNKPFFLYYAMQQPHVPRTPHPRFKGATGLGPRGDVIAEADWCIGEFLKTLEEENLLENTLILFSSDNGPVLNDGYYDDAVEKLGDHDPNGPLRGGKYSLFEAGTRVPFISYWKGKIQPGVSDAMVSQIDFLSSISFLIGENETYADSENLLHAFLGKTDRGRDDLVIESSFKTAYRNGNWAMIPPHQGPQVSNNTVIELGNAEGYQLYNLESDLGQEVNLAEENPEKLEQLIEQYQEIVK